MSRISDRIAELGLSLPAPAATLGSYVGAVRSGSYVYTSGQLPVVAGELMAKGNVPTQVDAADAQACARQCALNALAAISAVADLDDIVRVVKVVGFVASAPDFNAQPGVINGCSDLLGEIFGEAGRHARSAVGVAALPLGAPVEVELVVELKS